MTFIHYTFIHITWGVSDTYGSKLIRISCELYNSEYPFFCNYLTDTSEIYTDHRGVLSYILI